MTCWGVFPGASKPIQVLIEKSGTPDSASVGASGKPGSRRGATVARTLTPTDEPPCMTTLEGGMANRTCPEATARSPSAVDLYGTRVNFSPVFCARYSETSQSTEATEA